MIYTGKDKHHTDTINAKMAEFYTQISTYTHIRHRAEMSFLKIGNFKSGGTGFLTAGMLLMEKCITFRLKADRNAPIMGKTRDELHIRR